MQCSQDFGAITKELLKRKTKWGAKYFTHDKSYYLVSQTSMEFANITFMQLLLSEEISPDTETAMKEFAEKYRPVRQRTVRGETTTDKAGALPPTVYSKEQECNRVDLMEGLGNDLNTEEPMAFTMDEEEQEEDLFVHATSEGGDAPRVTFVDDCLVAVAVGEVRSLPDEYKTDSGDDFSVPEEGWFGQPKYSTPSKNHPTLCRFLLLHILHLYVKPIRSLLIQRIPARSWFP